MAIKNVEIQDSSGNIYYPHTDASVVKCGDSTVAAQMSNCAKKDGTLQNGLNAERLNGLPKDYFMRRYNLNEINIDTTDGNWTTNVSVDGFGTTPWSGWVNVQQYTSDHFYTQIATNCGGSAVMAIRTKYIIDGTWSDWKQLSTTETGIITLHNGWQNQIGTPEISRSGNLVTANLTITGGSCINGSSLGNIPINFRSHTDKYIGFKSCGADYAYNTNGNIYIRSDGELIFDASVIHNTRLVLNLSYRI